MIQKGREVSVPCLAGGNPYRYRMEEDGRLYAFAHGGVMLPQHDPFLRDAVNALAESESRCNEYHETTEKQAKRITELEVENERFRDDVRDLEGRLASAAEQLRARESEILVLRAEADELRGAIAGGRCDLIP